MISQCVLLVVLLGAVNQGIAACQNKPPMANYTADLMPGKFYLIITKPAFEVQKNQLRCGTEYIKSAIPTNWIFYMSTQGADGTVNNSIVNMTNLSPPGKLLVSAGAESFEASIIGAIKDKLNIYYACNIKTGKDAFWVNYNKRVNGANEMDDASIQYTFETLAQNQISVYGLKMVNNKNCNN